MVLSWTNIDELRAASQGELVQLWRRGVHKKALPVMPTKADIGCILSAAHLPGEPVKLDGRTVPDCEFPDRSLEIEIPHQPKPIVESPYEILRLLARREGLKAITERIRYARKFANKQRSAITWRNFVEAHLTIERESLQEPEWN